MTMRRIVSRLALWLAIAMTATAGTALAGGNPNFTLPLHAKVSQFEPCDGYLPVDCLANRPTVTAPSGQWVVVFLLVANYTQLAYVQTALEVDPSWTYTFGLWDCQPGFSGPPPSPPFGPTSGTIGYAFNCLSSGALAPVGRMFFNPDVGCIGQVQSTYPFGIHAFDCQQQIDQIAPSTPGQAARLGKICVGSGGNDACDAGTPVAAASWGLIKSSYR